MEILNRVLAKYSKNPDFEFGFTAKSFKISANIEADHKAILSALVDKGVVENQTDAVKLLIEAGWRYLLSELPDGLNSEIVDRKSEIFELINEHEYVEIVK